MEDLFNVTVPLGENAENNSANANEFRPKTTKAPNGVYEALIRFIPWAQNPSESLVSKNTAYLTNLRTGQKREFCAPGSSADPRVLRYAGKCQARDVACNARRVQDHASGDIPGRICRGSGTFSRDAVNHNPEARQIQRP